MKIHINYKLCLYVSAQNIIENKKTKFHVTSQTKHNISGLNMCIYTLGFRQTAFRLVLKIQITYL